MSEKKLILLIIIAGLLIRLINFNFPYFTADEARLGFRAYTLSKTGTDELGRKFPLIFNSLDDYQLPLTSYLTAAGVIIFGKSDLGVRIPFIFLGVLIVWLTYLISKELNLSKGVRLLSSLIVAFSPILIFVSKTPNETVLLTCLFQLFFYLLISKKNNIFTVVLVSVLLTLTSKIAWFILPPFTAFTLFFFQKDFSTKSKVIVLISFLMAIMSIIVFLEIPQAKRSLVENNFSIFSDLSIQNGINRLRGQGIASGWPPILDKLFFNRGQFFIVGFLNWLAALNLNVFFGEFDRTSQFGFVGLGAWPKVLIIPFIFSLFKIFKKFDEKMIIALGYLGIFTFPILFIKNGHAPNIAVITLPFMGILIAFGLLGINRLFKICIISFAVLEVFANLFALSPQLKSTNDLRPAWVDKIVLAGFAGSKKTSKIVYSEDIVSDITSFIDWYGPVKSDLQYSNIDFPYRFRVYNQSNFRIIAHEDRFYSCGLTNPDSILVSSKDLAKIRKNFETSVDNTFKDSMGNKVAFKLKPGICIK